MANPSWYELLGVPRDASRETIRASFLRLSLTTHPDRHRRDAASGDAAGERFHALRTAYETLVDAERRARYDRNLADVRGRIVSERVTLQEVREEGTMRAQGTGGVSGYGCRCGGVYWIDVEEVDRGIEFFPCDTCSLVVKVDEE